MGSPRFLLQIVDAETGVLVRFPGGGYFERQFIEACTDAIVQQGVGLFRTEARVKQAIAEGIAATIRDLKQDTVAVA